jgi:hypothetical protein
MEETKSGITNLVDEIIASAEESMGRMYKLKAYCILADEEEFPLEDVTNISLNQTKSYKERYDWKGELISETYIHSVDVDFEDGKTLRIEPSARFLTYWRKGTGKNFKLGYDINWVTSTH